MGKHVIAIIICAIFNIITFIHRNPLLYQKLIVFRGLGPKYSASYGHNSHGKFALLILLYEQIAVITNWLFLFDLPSFIQQRTTKR